MKACYEHLTVDKRSKDCWSLWRFGKKDCLIEWLWYTQIKLIRCVEAIFTRRSRKALDVHKRASSLLGLLSAISWKKHQFFSSSNFFGFDFHFFLRFSFKKNVKFCSKIFSSRISTLLKLRNFLFSPFNFFFQEEFIDLQWKVGIFLDIFHWKKLSVQTSEFLQSFFFNKDANACTYQRKSSGH